MVIQDGKEELDNEIIDAYLNIEADPSHDRSLIDKVFQSDFQIVDIKTYKMALIAVRLFNKLRIFECIKMKNHFALAKSTYQMCCEGSHANIVRAIIQLIPTAAKIDTLKRYDQLIIKSVKAFEEYKLYSHSINLQRFRAMFYTESSKYEEGL